MPLDLEPYRSLITRARMRIWQSDADGGRTWLDPEPDPSVGRPGGETHGWRDDVHPEDVDRCRELLRDAHDRRQAFELQYRLRRPDGTWGVVHERGVPVAGPGVHVGTCVDIEPSDMPEAYSGVAELFEMSLDNLCVAGLDGYFKRVNPSWTRTLGWSREELLSRPSAEFVHPDDREATLAARAQLRDGTPLRFFENRYLCKDGSYRWFEWRSVADLARGLVYAAARDITEQKRDTERLRQAAELQETLQRQLLFADRMASVGTLAAGVAHEINNPLSYLTANIALILEELDRLGNGPLSGEVAELKEMSGGVRDGAERIRKIVRGLETFSRVEEERRAVIEMVPALELAVDMTLNEIRHRARLVRSFGPTPPVEADESRLGQVFINLLLNAAQAVPEGDIAGNEIRIATSTDALGRAVIEIADTGAGIPAAIIDRVFDPFFTTKPVGLGTGLGLSICHTIVSGIGGEITVASREGRGTTFRVVLPAARPVPDSRMPGPRAPTAGARASVLVVDDEPAVGAVFRRVLRDHDVTVVTTGQAALDLLASGRSFHVILSDLMMSELSGMDFYDLLTRRFPDAAPRVVFVSGGAFTPAAHAFLDRVTNERIWKPFDHQYVRDIVQRFVELPSGPSDTRQRATGS